MIDNFKNNKLFTVGIEEEYMICHPITSELCNKADSLMNHFSSSKYKDRYSYELLQSEIESNTPICLTVNDAIIKIIELRNNLKIVADDYACKIGISGTHPTADPSNQKFISTKSYNWVKNQLKYYASQNITFSTHVHIGINDPELAIQISNIARCWIAPMLALSTNSPFFNSQLTGMKSSRVFQFGIFPRTNISHEIKDMNEYLYIIKKFDESNSIAKTGHIWWKIRPHLDFGTIEFRVCDAQRSLKKTKMIVAIFQAIVHQIYNDIQSNKIFNTYNLEFLNDGLWKAASVGLDSKIINPINEKVISMVQMIELMLEYINKSLLYFKTEDVVDTVYSIINGRTEADDQINIFNKYGFKGLNDYLIDNVDYKI